MTARRFGCAARADEVRWLRMHSDGVDLAPPHQAHARRLQFKTYLLILMMIVFGPLGNVLLGKGMKHVETAGGGNAGLIHLLGNGLITGTVWLGIAALIVFFVANMLVLSWADYSFVQPAGSLAYLIVALLSRFVLHESVTPVRWAGIAIICAGVAVISRTPARTTKETA